MRVSTDTALVDLRPGSQAEIGVDVVNTGEVIDGVTARVVGLPERSVTSRPAVLPLFPDSAGRLTLVLDLPPAFPAGIHPVTVEIRSRQADTPPGYVDLDVQVPTAAALGATAHPRLIRARRTARFVVSLRNTGNIALDVTLAAGDDERALGVQVTPGTLTVPAGTVQDVVVTVRAPRVWLGGDTDRPVQLTATGRPVDAAAVPDAGGSTTPAVPAAARRARHRAADDLDDELAALAGGVTPAAAQRTVAAEPVVATAVLTLRHRPFMTRGVLTAAILASIIALWAAVFLFGIGQVFGKDPLTKAAPASFFAGAGVSPAAAAQPLDGSAAGGAAARGAPAPAGALPKNGTLPSGQGGSVIGTVRAASSGEGTGRVLVEALRRTGTGALEVAGSAATQGDGSYEIAGLFPGRYLLRLSGDGFTTSYAPSGTSLAAARPIAVTAAETTSGADGVITGRPASITGTVDRGDTLARPISTVRVLPVGGATGASAKPVATGRTDAAGTYRLRNIPAPGDYRLEFTTPGYRTTSVTVELDGGASRLQPSVLLGAGPGTISGTATDGTAGLGGVTVTTTVGGKQVSTGTPTTGTVGQFVLADLPTPATYLLTFSAKGYADRTVVVDLGPGQQVPALRVALVRSSGQVTGRLVDASGAGLGGAEVTVGGAPDLAGTTTLTSGEVGGFSLQNLPRPGSYTLTFRLAGHVDTTVPLILDDRTPTAPLTVTMASAVGSITGAVTDATGAPVTGAVVEATDGVRSWKVSTAASAGVVAAGGYVVPGLTAGTYTVTTTGPDGTAATAIVTVAGGAATTLDVRLGSGG